MGIGGLRLSGDYVKVNKLKIKKTNFIVKIKILKFSIENLKSYRKSQNPYRKSQNPYRKSQNSKNPKTHFSRG